MTLVVGASVILQAIAALLAFRLVRATGGRLGWWLITAGLGLMAVRRAVTLFRLLSGDIAHPADSAAEWVALGISALMVAGLVSIRPFFIFARRSARALIKSEERFHSLFENALDIITIADDDGVIRYINPAAKRILGYELEAFEGRRLFDFVHPEDLPRAQEVFQSILGDPELTPSLDLRLRHEDGTWRHVEAMGRRLVDESGAAWVMVQTRDITERKRAEGALEESRRALATLMSNLPGMVYRCRNDPDWTMEFVSDGCRDLTGYGPEDLVENRTVSYGQLIHPDDRSPVWDEVQAAVAERRPFELTYRIRTAGGEERWVREQGVGVFEPDGGLVALEGFISDITERRRAEAMHARLSAAVEQTGETVVITDAEGTMQYVNPAFERVTGYSREEAVGRNPRILRSGKQDDAFYRAMWDTLTRGEIWQARFTNRKKDGSLYEADVTISPIRDGEGRIVAYVAVGRDVTDRLALERQLQLSHRLEAVGRLAGGIAHDFNNLLTAILGRTQLLAEDLPEGDPRRSDLTEIEEAANRAASLTRQLLAFSRRQVLQPRVLDLNAVVAEMGKLLRRLIREDVELVSRLAPELGSVRADPAQIEQVLMNLVVNARDAMPEGGRLTIETANVELDEEYVSRHAVAAPGSYVMLAVTDTGVGMDAETQAHLFEPFFTTKESGKGTGLGLATVYGIVKQSGGYVWVYSEPGEGTTFKIYLPRVEAPAEPLPPRERKVDPRGTETILVVEDEDAVRKVIGRVLRRQGYTVLEGARPEEALRIAESHPGPIHLLLTDLVMPGMGGREVAERVTALRPDAKVLYMSGYADATLQEREILEPGAGFVQKPFTAGRLGQRVREVLDLGGG